jgi:glycosyltransferase involved in cell wall biosynthesis
VNERIKLSICIPTLNRARFVGETLDSIVPQLTSEVEIVFVDGGSTDGTGEIIRAYGERHPQIRYFNTGSGGPVVPNAGFDADCDYTIEQARGEHCWLFSDDDIIKTGGVATVLRQLEDGDPDLLIVDSEVRDLTLERLLAPRRLKIDGSRNYGPGEHDNFFADVGDSLSFLGVVIIRRSCWRARDRQAYYGSYFIHVGVIFQMPYIARARVLTEPLVVIRLGNAMWTDKAFDVWAFKWPKLIWQFKGFSDGAKGEVTPRRPYLELPFLLMNRATGAYGLRNYRKQLAPEPLGKRRLLIMMVALIPGRLLNFVVMCRLALKGTAGQVNGYVLLKSKHSNWASRALAKRAMRGRSEPQAVSGSNAS